MAKTDRAITVTELIDQERMNRFQVVTILLCGLVLVLDGFATQSIGFLASSIAQSLHMSVHSFGPLFAAALIGLMLSSMLAGPIADRVGRKGPIIAATAIFGTFSILTAHAGSFRELVALRFLTGLGLGAAIPNVVALATEYSPRRLQQIVVTTIFCSMPLGALLGSLAGSVMLPRWGWRSVFHVSGILPLGLALVLLKVLPESLRFLSLRGAIRQFPAAEQHVEIEQSPVRQEERPIGVSVIQLFQDGRAVGTLLLWICLFMNLLLLYFIVNWLPALLRENNMPATAGILAVSLFSLGGIVGSILQGPAMKAFGARPVLLCEFALCLALLSLFSGITSLAPMMTAIFFTGILIQGAQAGLNASSAVFYPTSIRSTGVGWALGIGRLGSITGPLLGGIMLSRSWSLQHIFYANSIPALLAGIAILLSALIPRNTPFATAERIVK
jgi:AAHS family 4-hydroxybenzoate transporter-like MFS transporter